MRRRIDRPADLAEAKRIARRSRDVYRTYLLSHIDRPMPIPNPHLRRSDDTQMRRAAINAGILWQHPSGARPKRTALTLYGRQVVANILEIQATELIDRGCLDPLAPALSTAPEHNHDNNKPPEKRHVAKTNEQQ